MYLQNYQYFQVRYLEVKVSHPEKNDMKLDFSEIRFIFQWVEKLPVVQLKHETCRK